MASRKKKEKVGDEVGLPTNVDAERFVLGAIMLDAALFVEAAGILEVNDFSLEKHRKIFQRMGEIHAREGHIDRITVMGELTRYGELEACEGLAYLVTLDDGLPQVPHIESYARAVKDKAILRSVIQASHHLMNRCHMQEETVQEILAAAQESMTRLALLAEDDGGLTAGLDIMLNHKDGVTGFLDHAMDPGIPTGFPQLDDKMLGLQKGCQYVIAGATGSGKSALAGNIGINLAKQGYKIGLYGLEMSKEQYLARAVCAEGEVPLKAFLKGEMMPDQRDRASRAAEAISTLPFFIDDDSSMTITDFVRRVGRDAREKGLDGFILDYLQIINWQADPMKLKDEYTAITFASRAARLLARTHNLISIVLSQLSRPADKRKEGTRPKLTDLRASGAIEQDAYSVVMIWREELYKPGRLELKGKAEAIIRKARMGETGTAHLEFRGKYTKFVDNGPPSFPSVEEED